MFLANESVSTSSVEPFLLVPANRNFFLGKARYLGVGRGQILTRLFMLLVFVYMLNMLITNARLAQSGVRIDATVIKYEQVEDDVNSYYLTYGFNVVDSHGNSVSYTKRQAVGSNT